MGGILRSQEHILIDHIRLDVINAGESGSMKLLKTKWCLNCEDLIPGRSSRCPHCGSSSTISAKKHIQLLQKANAEKQQLLLKIFNTVTEGVLQ